MGKEKITMSFIVNEKSGVVVCKLSNCEFIAQDRACKYGLDPSYNEMMIPNNYYGVAKCTAPDVFDEEFGKKLALIKAKRKRCKAINNAIRKYINDTKIKLNNLEKYGIHEVPAVDV